MYVVEVKEDPRTGEPFIEFPDELMEGLDWKEGDTLQWEEMPDGSWRISKKGE